MTAGLLASLLAALAASAFFSGAETAAFALSPSDLVALRARRPEVAAALDALFRDRRRVLTSVLLGNLVAALFYFDVAREVAASMIPGERAAFEFGALLTLILLSELAPKTLALRFPPFAATLTARPLRFVATALAVPASAFEAVARAVRRTSTASDAEDDEGEIEPADLARLLAVAAKRGALGGDEHGWLKELVLLAEVRVKEAMTHRTDVVAFDLARPREELVALFRATRRNKIPAYEGSVDKMRGWIDAKAATAEPDRDLAEFLRPLGFVPESATAADALAELRRSHRRVLAVVDEYGGFEGIVTREDLVECVFGDLVDESDEAVEFVKEIAPGKFLVDAALPVTESRRAFGTTDAGVAATLGGLVTAELKRLPRVGDEVRLGRVVVRVAALRGRTAAKLRVRHVATPDTEADAEGDA